MTMAPGGAGTQAALLTPTRTQPRDYRPCGAQRRPLVAGRRHQGLQHGLRHRGEAVAAFKQAAGISGSTVRSHFGLRGQRGD